MDGMRTQISDDELIYEHCAYQETCGFHLRLLSVM